MQVKGKEQENKVEVKLRLFIYTTQCLTVHDIVHRYIAGRIYGIAKSNTYIKGTINYFEIIYLC